MTYVEELIAANPRHSGFIRIRTGLKKDGTIVARHATVVWDSGAYGAMKPAAIVSLGSTAALMGAYNIPHVLCEGFTVYTNTVPRGHVRAPAGPQAHFAVESHMDMIAPQMGLDPLAVPAEERAPQRRLAGRRAPAGGRARGADDPGVHASARAGAHPRSQAPAAAFR